MDIDQFILQFLEEMVRGLKFRLGLKKWMKLRKVELRLTGLIGMVKGVKNPFVVDPFKWLRGLSDGFIKSENQVSFLNT